MKRSNRLIILIGVFLAILAFMGVVLFAGKPGTATPTPSASPTLEATTTVVVAKTQILLGTKITADMLDLKTLTVSEKAALGPDVYTTTSEVINKVAGITIQPAEVIYSSKDFLPPGTIAKGTDLAPSVTAGMVAMAMEVDQVNGVGTLLIPGDHVDVILAVELDSTLKGNEKVSWVPGNQTYEVKTTEPSAKIVFQNRKILATLLPETPDVAGGAPNAGTSPTPVPAKTADTITNNGQHMIVLIEVKPDEAEVIRWAQRAEKADPQNYITLGLALRSDKDNAAPDTKTLGVTFNELVKRYGVLPTDPRAILPPDIAAKISW